MEVVPCNPKTEAFLAHSAVPIEFTNDDWKQIKEGNYLVKVIYLPDPQFQDVAGTGTDEIISTRLEPGADPIQEALRRGSILVVLRMGNVDQEAPNTPPLNAGPPDGWPGRPRHDAVSRPAAVESWHETAVVAATNDRGSSAHCQGANRFESQGTGTHRCGSFFDRQIPGLAAAGPGANDARVRSQLRIAGVSNSRSARATKQRADFAANSA